ncbi:MAG: hypothetical protein KKD63_16625 [Proteobacteria bacterium]|nr:hypothetical protein [Pseudomonadota bacterium]
MNENNQLMRGCIVKMKPNSCVGWGNEQCVSYVSEPLGSEIGLFGHNQAYKTYDVQEVISFPDIRQIASLINSVIVVADKFITKVQDGRARSVETYSDLQKLKAEAMLLKANL